MLVNLCCMKQSKKAMASFKTERQSQMEMLRKSQQQLTENRESEIKLRSENSNEDKKEENEIPRVEPVFKIRNGKPELISY